VRHVPLCAEGLSESLGDATHFGLAAGPQGGNGRNSQAVVDLEEPAHSLLVGEAIVIEYKNRSSQFGQRSAVPQEVCGNLKHAVATDGEKMMVVDQLSDPALGYSEHLNECGDGQPFWLRILGRC